MANTYVFIQHILRAAPAEGGGTAGPHSSHQSICWGHFQNPWVCQCFCCHTAVRRHGAGPTQSWADTEGGTGLGLRAATPEGERKYITDALCCGRPLPTQGQLGVRGSLSTLSLVFLSFLGAFKSSRRTLTKTDGRRYSGKEKGSSY